jgi:alpha-L-fucosidase
MHAGFVPIQPWFTSAKLGIFIHYGIYSVEGLNPSWSFFEGTVSYDHYMDQRERFTASRFNADAWASLARGAGAKYMVLTAKHHDGIAMFDTNQGGTSVVKQTPAHRDIVAEYADAARRAGLRVGLYYSLPDWTHPDYPSMRPHPVRDERESDSPYAYAPRGTEDPLAWSRYLAYLHGQLNELQRGYGTIDLLWFDGDWERDEQQWDSGAIRKALLENNPDVVINDRLIGAGDYATPEQGLPIVAPDGSWELCATVGDGWSWQPEHTEKTSAQLVRLLAQVVGKGGNLLLNIAPHEDGTIGVAQQLALSGLGRWVHKHQEAIYTAVAGIPEGHFYGPTMLSADRKVLYLVCLDRPVESIEVRGVHGNPTSVSVVGDGRELSWRKTPGLGIVPGLLYLNVPSDSLDEVATVFRLEFADIVTTYHGDGNIDDRFNRPQ